MYEAVLMPWIDANGAHVAWLKTFAARKGSPVPKASTTDLWDLYSISRVNEFLLLSLQPGEALFRERDEERLNITLQDYTAFMSALGFTVRYESRFTPVLHEIVEVANAQDIDAPISLVGGYWPTLMLGELVFSRGGAMVEAGSNHASKTAETSSMYWAWRRRNRPARDLSHGWGSNSQWRTSFRRDYVFGNRAWLNVDAHRSPLGDVDELSEEQRHELLLHRCLLKSIPASGDGDFWPFDLTGDVPLYPS